MVCCVVESKAHLPVRGPGLLHLPASVLLLPVQVRNRGVYIMQDRYYGCLRGRRNEKKNIFFEGKDKKEQKERENFIKDGAN